MVNTPEEFILRVFAKSSGRLIRKNKVKGEFCAKLHLYWIDLSALKHKKVRTNWVELETTYLIFDKHVFITSHLFCMRALLVHPCFMFMLDIKV